MFARPEKIIEQFQLGEGMHVADLGVGSGVYTFAAARDVGKDGVVYACDLQKELVQKVHAEARHAGFSNVHTMWVDLEEERGTTLADASVHAVIVSTILFQIEHKERFLKEVFRITRPGGKILIVDWNDSYGGIGPHAAHILKRHTAQTLAESAGFVFEKDIDAGSHHYGMILRKPKDAA
ncbi:methyltransferase domain-containing protein [Candidatus Campbellbacteria bacterium]|nr:MAG: methyltransferase domain-containing protein [Candidatus Campbellbacteria bacterium]